MDNIIFGDWDNDNNPYCNTACKALVEYERKARLRDHIDVPARNNSMTGIANKWAVSIPDMKKHWVCTDRILGKDPDEMVPNYILRNL